MGTAGKITDLLNSVSTSDDQITILESLNTLLAVTGPHELSQIAPNVSFDIVFECLSSENKEEVELGCSVLSKFLTACEPSLMLKSFERELIKWLSHSKTPVKRLALTQLSTVVRENEETLAKYPDVVFRLVKCLAEERLELAEKSGVILASLGKSKQGLSVLFSEPVMKGLKEVMALNDVMRYRVYKMIVDVSCVSAETMNRYAETGLLQQLVEEMQKDDILLQLNCLEMLSDLAQQPHGLAFLDEQGIIHEFEDMMSQMQDNPFGNIILPGLMKFFGGLSRIHPKEVCGKFNKFTHIVFENVGGGDRILQGVAIDTIGFIGSTPDGKLALEKLGSSMESCMPKLGNIIKTSMSDLRSRTIQAVTNLMTLPVENQTVELLKLTESWFQKLCSKPFEVIWHLTRQPFMDTRQDCYRLLQALAAQQWGQRSMNETAGFHEFLLDRSTESSREAKEAKYEIIKTLATSPTIIEVFGRPFYVRIMEYYHQGAFFVRAQADIAFEEG